MPNRYARYGKDSSDSHGLVLFFTLDTVLARQTDTPLTFQGYPGRSFRPLSKGDIDGISVETASPVTGDVEFRVWNSGSLTALTLTLSRGEVYAVSRTPLVWLVGDTINIRYSTRRIMRGPRVNLITTLFCMAHVEG